MAKLRSVNTHFWDDTYVITLDPIEKLLFLYLLTNPLTDICGAYEINLRRVALDTGIDQEMVLKMLDRFHIADKITYHKGWILIHNFVKNQSTNPSVLEGVTRSLNLCPDWIRHSLSQAGGRLPQSVLLNLTLPNLTLLNGDGEEPEKETDLPLSPSSSEKETRRLVAVPVNASAQRELETWLDAIAPFLGAKKRSTIADLRKWEDVCIKAISEERSVLDMIDAIKSELGRTKETPQYFSATSVLKKLQTASAKPERKKFLH